MRGVADEEQGVKGARKAIYRMFFTTAKLPWGLLAEALRVMFSSVLEV